MGLLRPKRTNDVVLPVHTDLHKHHDRSDHRVDLQTTAKTPAIPLAHSFDNSSNYYGVSVYNCARRLNLCISVLHILSSYLLAYSACLATLN